MLQFGFGALLVGCAVLLFGLFNDTTVASAASFGSRTHNLGLLNQQIALVTAGAGLMIVGSIFAVGSMILEKLSQNTGTALASTHPGKSSQLPATSSLTTYPAADPSPTARRTYPNNADGWKAVTQKAEAEGWRTRSGLSSVTFTHETSGQVVKAHTPQAAADEMKL
jgi:hypothetical protein